MNEERVTNIRELAYAMLKGWRLFLILPLLAGIILGALTFWNNSRLSFEDTQITARQDVLKKTNLEIDPLLKSIEKKKVDQLDKEEYLNQSVLMQANPEAVGVARIEIAIKLINSSPLDAGSEKSIIRRLIANYLMANKSDALFNYMNLYKSVANMSLQKKYLLELVDISSTSLDTIVIEARNLDPASAASLADVALNYLRSFSLNSLQIYQPHNLEVVSSVSSTAAYPYLPQQRQDQLALLAAIKTSIKADQDKLKAIIVADLEENSRRSVPASVVIGLIIGILLSAIFEIAKYIFNSKLKTCDEVQLKTGIFVIGKISLEK